MSGDRPAAVAATPAGSGRRPSTLHPATSVYLDALRLFAAVGVLLGHAQLPWFSTGIRVFPEIAHELVVLFFFLSGYVVADATLGKNRRAEEYAAARLSRLLSVVVPALVLTAVARVIGLGVNPEFYAQFERGQEPLRLGLSALFAQELWFLSASPPTNAPLWSLGYEFWFYGLFGGAVFVRGRGRKLAVVVLLAAIAGPKLLLLLPVWLLGVAGWRLRTASIPRWLAVVGLIGSVGAAGWLIGAGWHYPGGPEATPPWFYSGRWVSDTVLGTLIFAHVCCFDRVCRDARVPRWLERPVRRGAGGTFSLYAYHFPLLVLAAATVPGDPADPWRFAALLLGVLAAVAGLQQLTENRREWWQVRVAAALGRIAGQWRRAPGSEPCR